VEIICGESHMSVPILGFVCLDQSEFLEKLAGG
jgi:hypothetical protein